MLRFLRKRAPEERFWNWFTLNSRKLFRFETDQERIFDELSMELEKLHESICFEFGPVREDGRREFIISADGDRSAFPLVQSLARTAPPFSEWIIIPFRPPKNLGDYPTVLCGGIEVDSRDIWFSHETEGTITHVELYIRDYDPVKAASIGEAVYLLLDTALGEYVVETRIGAVGRNPLPADPHAEGLLPFAELPSVVALPSQ